MKTLNKVTLIGRLTKDVEFKTLESGIDVANFSVATSEGGYTKQDGTEVPEVTEFHNVTAWRGLATLAEKYLAKGSPVYLEGKLSTRKYEKDGVTHYNTGITADNIILLPNGGGKSETPAEEIAEDAGTDLPF